MKKYIKNTIDSVIEESTKLLTAQDYVDNKRRRLELAKFYKKILHLGSSFPERPKDMRTSSVDRLYKDVSNSCPDCVKPSVMLSTAKNAIRVIYKYVNILKEIDTSTIDLGEPKSVHDLKPNN